LKLVVAHLLIARLALGALAAARNKWHRDAITGFPIANVDADLDNLTSEFMPRHVRQRADVGIVSLPSVPIASTDPGCPNGDHGAVGLHDWFWNIGQFNRATELVIKKGLHGIGR
jgi:hypothetical protein